VKIFSLTSSKPKRAAEKKYNRPGELLVLPAVVAREPCPFYGFRRVGMTMYDAEDDRCALLGSKCKMEEAGRPISWGDCDVLEPEVKDSYVEMAMSSTLRVFPREMSQPRVWPGLSFKKWHEFLFPGDDAA
jgi:hypothetical protein